MRHMSQLWVCISNMDLQIEWRCMSRLWVYISNYGPIDRIKAYSQVLTFWFVRQVLLKTPRATRGV